MTKHVLFPVEELEPGGLRAVSVDGVALVIVRAPDGVLRALRDRCPHEGASLSKGSVVPFVTGRRLGDYQLVDHAYILRCPWHGFEFDLETGRCSADPVHSRVRAYEVTTEDGQVVVTR